MALINFKSIIIEMTQRLPLASSIRAMRHGMNAIIMGSAASILLAVNPSQKLYISMRFAGLPVSASISL